jgi:hypothetical protein
MVKIIFENRWKDRILSVLPVFLVDLKGSMITLGWLFFSLTIEIGE